MGTTYTGTSATITGLTPGTQYRFRVRARNAVGYGPFSDWSAAGTPTGTGSGPSPTSPPGETWTKISAPLSHFAGITSTGTAGQERIWAWKYNPSAYAGLAQWNAYSLVYSTDGVAWTDSSTFTVSAPLPGDSSGGGVATFVPNDVAYGNGTYVATGKIAAYVGVSSNGTSWQKVALPAGSTGATGVAFINGKFITLGTSVPYFSTTGLSWGKLYSAAGATWPVVIAATSSQFLWQAQSGRLGYSDASTLNGLTINGSDMLLAPPTITSSAFSSGLPVLQTSNGRVLVADTNGKLYTTYTGTAWTTRTLPAGLLFCSGPQYQAQVSGASTARPLAASDGANIVALVRTADKATRTIARSTDSGATWETRVTLPELIEWSEIVYFKGKYIAIGFGTPDNFAAYYTT